MYRGMRFLCVISRHVRFSIPLSRKTSRTFEIELSSLIGKHKIINNRFPEPLPIKPLSIGSGLCLLRKCGKGFGPHFQNKGSVNCFAQIGLQTLQ